MLSNDRKPEKVLGKLHDVIGNHVFSNFYKSKLDDGRLGLSLTINSEAVFPISSSMKVCGIIESSDCYVMESSLVVNFEKMTSIKFSSKAKKEVPLSVTNFIQAFAKDLLKGAEFELTIFHSIAILKADRSLITAGAYGNDCDVLATQFVIKMIERFKTEKKITKINTLMKNLFDHLIKGVHFALNSAIQALNSEIHEGQTLPSKKITKEELLWNINLSKVYAQGLLAPFISQDAQKLIASIQTKRYRVAFKSLEKWADALKDFRVEDISKTPDSYVLSFLGIYKELKMTDLELDAIRDAYILFAQKLKFEKEGLVNGFQSLLPKESMLEISKPHQKLKALLSDWNFTQKLLREMMQEAVNYKVNCWFEATHQGKVLRRPHYFDSKRFGDKILVLTHIKADRFLDVWDLDFNLLHRHLLPIDPVQQFPYDPKFAHVDHKKNLILLILHNFASVDANHLMQIVLEGNKAKMVYLCQTKNFVRSVTVLKNTIVVMSSSLRNAYTQKNNWSIIQFIDCEGSMLKMVKEVELNKDWEKRVNGPGNGYTAMIGSLYEYGPLPAMNSSHLLFQVAFHHDESRLPPQFFNLAYNYKTGDGVLLLLRLTVTSNFAWNAESLFASAKVNSRLYSIELSFTQNFLRIVALKGQKLAPVLDISADSPKWKKWKLDQWRHPDAKNSYLLYDSKKKQFVYWTAGDSSSSLVYRCQIIRMF